MFIRKQVVLDSERDGDIVAWLEAQDNQSEAVRDAIRAFMDRERVTLRSVLEAVSRIEDRLASGDFTPGDGAQERTSGEGDAADVYGGMFDEL